MKGNYLLLAMALLGGKIAMAQNIVTICDTDFYVEINNRDGSVTLADYEYVVEDVDTKYPMNNQKRKIKGLKKSDRVLEIPSTVRIGSRDYVVTGIGHAAFADYQNFDYVSIPMTVTHIDEYAFFRCNMLEITIPGSVLTVGEKAFASCPRLKRITYPEHLAQQITKDTYKGSKHAIAKCDYNAIIPDFADGTRITTGTYTSPSGQVYSNTIVTRPEASASNEPTDAYPASQQGAMASNYTPVAAPQQSNPSTKSNNSYRYKIAPGQSDVDNVPMTTKRAENTFAFIIANENYRNVPKVECALNDGRKFQEYCNATLGIPSENIRYTEDATVNDIRFMINKMRDFAEIYGDEAKIIFYYTGHGMPSEDGRAFLLPVDGVATDASTGYYLDNLYAELGNLPAQNVTAFIDACFSGHQRDGQYVVEGIKGLYNAQSQKKPTGNLVVFAAAMENETANFYPQQAHSLFTYFLLKKLQETKGDVTLGELSEYINSNVRKKALTALDTKQTPVTTISKTLEKNWKSINFK